VREIVDARVIPSYIRWFHDLRLTALALGGGKNASLGELIGTLGPSGSGCRADSQSPPRPTAISWIRTVSEAGSVRC
jgi:hypothetical protein